MLIGDVLYELALTLLRRPWRRRTGCGVAEEITEALEAVLDDKLCFCADGPVREELSRAIIKYQQMAAGASRTKPR